MCPDVEVVCTRSNRCTDCTRCTGVPGVSGVKDAPKEASVACVEDLPIVASLPGIPCVSVAGEVGIYDVAGVKVVTGAGAAGV